MKRIRATLALALLVTTLQLSGGLGPAAACAGTRVHSFHVQVEWAKKTYRSSDKAKAVVTVTRPAHEDPAGLGITYEPPVSVPEPGVTVATSLQTGRYPYPYGAGITDDNGQVTLNVPLKEAKQRGPLDAQTLVWKIQNQGGPACTEFEEYGYLYQQGAIKIS